MIAIVRHPHTSQKTEVCDRITRDKVKVHSKKMSVRVRVMVIIAA